MNLSEEYQRERLKEAQETIFKHLLPAIVALVIFCFIGIVGNTITLIFFARRSQRSSTFVMITSLAAVDLAVCVAMILSILELATLVTAYYSVVCKLTHFLGRWSVGASCFVLWIITIDRYRKICKPFKKQLTVLTAKQIVVGFVILALVLSVKELVHYSSINIPLTVSNSNETINGYYCRELEGSGYKISIPLFNAIDILLFAIIWIGQIVAYVLIIYNLIKIRKKKENITGLTFSKQSAKKGRDSDFDNSTVIAEDCDQGKKTSKVSDKISVDKTFDIDLDKTFDIDLDDNPQGDKPDISPDSQNQTPFPAGTQHTDLDKPPGAVGTVELSKKKPPKHKEDASPRKLPRSRKGLGHRKRISLSKIEIKLTLMLFTVSLVFVLCFTPYFVLVMWAFSSGKEFELDAGIKFAIRLPFLNSVFNPIVYFAFNAEFRSFVRSLTWRRTCFQCRERA